MIIFMPCPPPDNLTAALGESRVADSGSFVCWLGPNADEVRAVAGRTWLARARDIGEQGPLTH